MLALTREVSSRIADCELTHLTRAGIDPARARLQHAAYEEALRACGCTVERIAPLDDHPDGVFVEDTVVVLDEVAVLTRPGAVSRRGEVDSMEAALEGRRECRPLVDPATLDGGDVIVAGRTIFVGASARSSEAGARALREIVGDFGYAVRRVPMRNCLHLKTAATLLSDDRLLYDPNCVELSDFGGLAGIPIDPAEPFAANALRVGERVIYPESFRRTARRLEAEGIDVVPVPADELAKAEGGVTCCSVLLS